MFAEEIQRAVMGAPRARLPALALVLWKGHGAGAINDDDAQQLAELIEARKKAAPLPPVRRNVGSRPRSPASMERRRRLVASGWMPPQIAGRFTLAEQAVLAVVASEINRRHGDCHLTIGHIAALAGVCRSTVQKALREAKALGFVTVDEWRITAWRNAPNTVRIVSREWQAWLRLAARRDSKRGGFKTSNPTHTQEHNQQGRWPQRSPAKIEGRIRPGPGQAKNGAVT